MAVILVSLILGALVALYFYLTKNYKYWQKRGIPCMDGALPGVGHMLSVISMKMNISDLCCKIYNDNKDRSMVGIYEFMRPLLMIREPELVKTVLQTNFSSFSENGMMLDLKINPLLANNPFFLTGEKWLISRKRMTYAFSSMRLKILLENVKSVCTTCENYINEKLNNVEKAEFELKSLFARYSAQVVAAAGFGIDGYCFNDEKKDMSFRKLGQALFQPSIRNKIIFTLAFLIPSLNKILKISFIPKLVDQTLRAMVADLMEQRRKDGKPKYDFLYLMAKLEKTERDKFDTEMLTGLILPFVIDGYESTSTVLSFIGFHLASNPEIQKKLRKEVVSVINRYDGEITYEGLREMTYMDQVFNEVMRLLPFGVFVKKKCTEEFELKGSDGIVCRVQPGTQILIPIQGLHIDPQYWENPEKFDPERFGPDSKHSIEKFAYLPFSEGPRICVGMRMAQLLIKAGLAMIMRKYSMELSLRTQIPLKMIPGAILPTPKGGVWVYVRRA